MLISLSFCGQSYLPGPRLTRFPRYQQADNRGCLFVRVFTAEYFKLSALLGWFYRSTNGTESNLTPVSWSPLRSSDSCSTSRAKSVRCAAKQCSGQFPSKFLSKQGTMLTIGHDYYFYVVFAVSKNRKYHYSRSIFVSRHTPLVYVVAS